MYRYIFGPVLSRRFGLSLGIDLSPEKKSCNFDCLYCELSRAKPVDKIENEPAVEDIIGELTDWLSKNGYPDVITVTANGEPTLYSKLEDLIDGINRVKGKSRSLILSNGSTINDENIRRALRKFDIVKLSLDAAEQKIFEKVDRPLKGIKIDEIIEGMISFRREYIGTLVIEILIVKNVNDKDEIIKQVVRACKKINPDRVDISTIDRPPAYRVEPVNNKRLYEIADLFEGLNLNVVVRKDDGSIHKLHLSEEDIIHSFKNRAYTESDIDRLFDNDTKRVIYSLLKKGIIKEKYVGNVKFLKAG